MREQIAEPRVLSYDREDACNGTPYRGMYARDLRFAERPCLRHVLFISLVPSRALPRQQQPATSY